MPNIIYQKSIFSHKNYFLTLLFLQGLSFLLMEIVQIKRPCLMKILLDFVAISTCLSQSKSLEYIYLFYISSLFPCKTVSKMLIYLYERI